MTYRLFLQVPPPALNADGYTLSAYTVLNLHIEFCENRRHILVVHGDQFFIKGFRSGTWFEQHISEVVEASPVVLTIIDSL